ncbi:MAG: hypothetical protein R3F33_09470 [Planctomycetota bacterium]
MLFSPDVLHGRLPAADDEVVRLAERGLAGAREAGLDFAVLHVRLDGFADWDLRKGTAFAQGLFVSLLERLLPVDGILAGRREAGECLLYLQGLSPERLATLAGDLNAVTRNASWGDQIGALRVSVSIGGAHLRGFRGEPGACDLASLEQAAARGAQLAQRSGGDRAAMIERFSRAAVRRMPVPEPAVELQSVAPQVELAPPAVEVVDMRAPQPPAMPLPAELDVDRLLRDRDAAWERRVDLLERRLEKLGAMLDQVSRGQRTSAAGDSGVPSRFRAVQGLSEDDVQVEAKRGLMAAIYEANLELRNRMSAG